MQPGEKHIFPLCIASLHFCSPFPSDSSHDPTNIAWQSHSPCRGNAGGVYRLVSYPWAELNSAVLANFSHALISSWLTLAIHRKGHQETVIRDITPVIASLDCPFTEPIPLPCMLETQCSWPCGRGTWYLPSPSIQTHLGLAFQSLNKYSSCVIELFS